MKDRPTARMATDNDLPPDIVTLCKRLAAKQARRCPVEYDDLLQVCLLAAWVAIPNFDASRGVKLTTYLNHRVRFAMVDYMRDVNETVKVPRLKFRTAGRAQTISMEVLAIRMRQGESSGKDPGPDVAHPADHRQPDEALERADWWRFDRQLRGLSQTQRQIMRLYYRHGITMREIGDVLGVSESRISQLHSQAIDLLRNQSLTEKRDGYRRTRARR